MNHLLRFNVHKTYADVFIPGGGRPRTLNASNVHEFLDETGKPTTKGIVEGANLYLDDAARAFLEERGCLIIKDSSANKAGVICSSFEVLSGLTLGDELFMAHKERLAEEILRRLRLAASNEADLLLNSHKKTNEPLTVLSDRISKRINQFTYQILEYLEGEKELSNAMMKTFLSYCLPLLREEFEDKLISEIPPLHKRAIIACHIGAQAVYHKGLDWFPSIVDIIPLLIESESFEV